MKKQTANHGSVKPYTIGFILSIILTLIAYVIVVNQYFDGWRMAFILLELAVIQLWVQVVFFLHLGRDAKSRWNLVSFLFMIIVVLIIGIGSLWIMNNLHYSRDDHGNEIAPSKIEEYLKIDEGY